MPDTLLILGGFVFPPGTFAIPETINGGGKQKLITHKLIGGQRIIQPMGFDPEKITWKGRFRSATAVVFVRLLETLARSGKPVVFAYYLNRYVVYVEEFKWEFDKFYEIRYTISLEVQVDLTQVAVGRALASLESLFNASSALLSSIVSLLPDLNVALAAVTTAKFALGSLNGASAAGIATLAAPLAGLAAATGALGAAFGTGAAAGPMGGVVAGGNPASMATGLTNQASAFQGQANCVQCGAVTGNMQTNLASGGYQPDAIDAANAHFDPANAQTYLSGGLPS